MVICKPFKCLLFKTVIGSHCFMLYIIAPLLHNALICTHGCFLGMDIELIGLTGSWVADGVICNFVEYTNLVGSILRTCKLELQF